MATYYPPPATYPLPPPPGDHYGYPREYERDYRPYPEYDDLRDRGGRGRSRSPEDEYRRRRRSISPGYPRGDRYDGRPRYDDYDRARHSPRAPHPFDYRGNKPVDPFTGDYPVSFKHFCDWLRYTNPDIDLEIKAELERDPGDPATGADRQRVFWSKRYEEYKKDHLQVVTRRIFNYHKGSTWFIERYDPSPQYEAQRARVRFEGWNGRQEAFIEELDDGKHDVDLVLEEPESESAKEELVTKENGLKKESDTDVNMDGERANDGPDEFAAPADEDAPKEEKEDVAMADVKSELPSPAENGADRRSKDVRSRIPPELQIFVKPEGNQLLIRTIPPAMTRDKIEEVCRGVEGFRYLSLGDPQPKKSFYRPGWVRYEDFTDMEKAVRHFGDQRIEGFTMHVVHNTQPYASRLRVAPPVSNKPERMLQDLQNVKALARALEAEWARVKAKVRNDELEAQRAAAQKVEEENEPKGEDDVKLEPFKVEEGEPASKFQTSEEKLYGSERVESRVEELKEQLRVKAQQRAEEKGVEAVDKELLATAELRLELDMWLTYLRQAFNTCYYCALICDHAEALQRKCVKHIRQAYVKPTPSEEEAEKEGLKKRGPADDRWLEWLDAKVELLLRKDDVDPSVFGGMNFEDEIKRTVMPHVKQEDEGKFRCQLCTKLFKAQVFVEKHVANKHSEVIKDVQELVPFLNNFALDPVHITPQQHTSAFTAPPRRDSRHEPNFHEERAALHRHADADRGYGPYNGAYPNGGPPGYGPPSWDPYYDGRRSPYGRPGEYPGPSNGDYPRPALPDSLPPKPTGELDMGRGPVRRRRTEELELRSPPANAKEDPRARAGRKVSYNDMDSVAEGDVELNY